MHTEAVPWQLSLDPRFAGYQEDAQHIGAWLTIWLDGVKQSYAVAYDIAAGTLIRFALNERGAVIAEGDEVKLETVHGRVVVERRRPA